MFGQGLTHREQVIEAKRGRAEEWLRHAKHIEGNIKQLRVDVKKSQGLSDLAVNCLNNRIEELLAERLNAYEMRAKVKADLAELFNEELA